MEGVACVAQRGERCEFGLVGLRGGEIQVCITPANRAQPCPRGCVPPPSHGAFIPLGNSAEEVGSFL